MVPHPRTPLRPHGLRPLGRPHLLRVTLDADGLPTRVATRHGKQLIAVTAIGEVWRIAEGWWRERPLRRTYYHLTLSNGHSLTCFHDDNGDSQSAGWYEQRY